MKEGFQQSRPLQSANFGNYLRTSVGGTNQLNQPPPNYIQNTMSLRNMVRSGTMGKMATQQSLDTHQLLSTLNEGRMSPAKAQALFGIPKQEVISKSVFPEPPPPPQSIATAQTQNGIMISSKKKVPSAHQIKQTQIAPGINPMYQQTMKPPRNPSKSNQEKQPKMASNKLQPQPLMDIDHAKQRQKLQELIKKMMNHEEADNNDMDIAALYDSLNPSKRSLLPLEYQAILKLKGQPGHQSSMNKQLPQLKQPSIIKDRPPSNRTRQISSAQHQYRLGQLTLNNEKVPFKKKDSFNSEYTATTNATTARLDNDNYINFHKSEEENQMSGVLGLKKKRKLVSKGGSKNNSIIRTQNALNNNGSDRPSTLSRQASANLPRPTDDEDMAELQMSKQDLHKHKIAQHQHQMERDIEVRDKFKLFAWGLNLKEAMLRRSYFLEAVTELKSKLRKVLFMWQDKKAEQNFKELANLIENYDKDDPYYQKKKLGKLSKKKQPALFMTKEPLLQTVDEREEEDKEEESFMINPERKVFNADDLDVQDYSQAVVGNDEDAEGDQFDDEELEIFAKLQEEERLNSSLSLSKFDSVSIRQQNQEQQALLQEEENIKMELEVELEQDRIKFQQELQIKAQQETNAKDIQNQLNKAVLDGALRWGLKEIYGAQMKVLWTLKMWVQRRRYLKIREGIKKLKEDRRKWEESRQPSFIEQMASVIEKQNQKQQQQKPKPTKEEAVLVIERSWIRFRIREEAKKMREMLKSVPYECRRSYVKYFDLKFKTIKLRTDVETFSRYIR